MRGLQSRRSLSPVVWSLFVLFGVTPVRRVGAQDIYGGIRGTITISAAGEAGAAGATVVLVGTAFSAVVGRRATTGWIACPRGNTR